MPANFCENGVVAPRLLDSFALALGGRSLAALETGDRWARRVKNDEQKIQYRCMKSSDFVSEAAVPHVASEACSHTFGHVLFCGRIMLSNMWMQALATVR